VSENEHPAEEFPHPDGVVIRDKRRIDPVTGQVRQPDTAPETAAEREAEPADIPKAEALQLAERTADLQRVQAEYANYRKRVERDRVVLGELAAGRVLASLLPVLDDIDRAREHGDVTGPFKAVVDQLDAILAKNGLVAFGEVGDPFDPAIHDAVMHQEGGDVHRSTVTAILRRGYRHGERLLRPAMVGVTDPPTAVPPAPEPASE
jgi:molecular chaperone GrpE